MCTRAECLPAVARLESSKNQSLGPEIEIEIAIEDPCMSALSSEREPCFELRVIFADPDTALNSGLVPVLLQI
jgi:hypothetical protein